MKDELLYLRHILERCERISRFTGLDKKEEFFASELLQDAVIRNLEVIGEAAKGVSQKLRAAAPEVDWRAVCGLRDLLIHGYFGVDLLRVWEIATEATPRLRTSVLKLLESAKR